MVAGLYVVGTPIGNLEDLTSRAAETLRAVEVVYAEDTRRTGRLLGAIGSEARLRSLHAHNEARRTDEVLARLAAGGACALVSDAGTPAVSDPGRRLVAAVLEAGHRAIPVPGPSAVVAALSVAGLPAGRFGFVGFPPRAAAERDAWLADLAAVPVTTVLFESPRRLPRLLEELEAAGLGERTAVLCRELTKLHEEVRRASVAELRRGLAGRPPRGEVTLVLEGEGGSEERPPEALVKRRARGLAAAGLSTREIAERLQEELGVARNRAYEAGLRAGDETSR